MTPFAVLTNPGATFEVSYDSEKCLIYTNTILKFVLVGMG